MKAALRLSVTALTLSAAACTSTRPAPPPPPPEDHTVAVPPSVGVYKVGQPYQVDNVWYYPRE